jgi:hypothetical protein
MKNEDLNKIAAIEQAISAKYGEEAIQNPRAEWDETKEKEYLEQMRELYDQQAKNAEWEEKVEVNGIKVTKKLLNRESLKCCPICGNFPKSAMDGVCLTKFDCCNNCYVQYVEGRETRWQKGWRPNEINKRKT